MGKEIRIFRLNNHDSDGFQKDYHLAHQLTNHQYFKLPLIMIDMHK
uniref:Uncharacterized protein n=1 Tax=Tetranychus urticae TaxID=32264 RepID=T1K131_TETUR